MKDSNFQNSIENGFNSLRFLVPFHLSWKLFKNESNFQGFQELCKTDSYFRRILCKTINVALSKYFNSIFIGNRQQKYLQNWMRKLFFKGISFTMPKFQQLNFTFTAENSNFPREKDGRRQNVNKSKEKNPRNKDQR